MCLLDEKQKEEVEHSLRQFFVKGVPFTGWEVAQDVLSTEFVATYANAAAAPAREISSYVRELYNNNWFPEEWGSRSIRAGGKAALHYFKVPPRSAAGIAAEKIRRKMLAPAP